MAEIVTIARPYAEAIFRLAKEQNKLKPWSDTLSFMAAAMENEQLQLAISDPNLNAQQIEKLFFAIGEGRLDDSAKNLVKVLIENDRLTALPQIHTLYEQLRAEQEGVLEAQVTSAYALEPQQVQQLVNRLEIRFKRKVTAQIKVDPELIGGIKVEIGDEVFDASVKAKLETMAFALTH